MPSHELPPLVPFPDINAGDISFHESSFHAGKPAPHPIFDNNIFRSGVRDHVGPHEHAAPAILQRFAEQSPSIKEESTANLPIVAEIESGFMDFPGTAFTPKTTDNDAFSLHDLAASLIAKPVAMGRMPTPQVEPVMDFSVEADAFMKFAAPIPSLKIESDSEVTNASNDDFLFPRQVPSSVKMRVPSMAQEDWQDIQASPAAVHPGFNLPPPISPHLPLVEESFVSVPTDTKSTGVGLLITGTLLILLGTFAACMAAGIWFHDRNVSPETWSWLPVWSLTAIGLLVLGLGSVYSRRWAPPLIHALGWVVVLTVLLYLLFVTSGLFYIASRPGHEIPLPDRAMIALLGVAIFGVAFPLACITYHQRDAVARFCAHEDTRARWTDPLPIPILMVFLTGCLATSAAICAMWNHEAFPFFGKSLHGIAAGQAWTVTTCLLVVTTILCAMARSIGWWLFLAIVVACMIALFLTPHTPLPAPLDDTTWALTTQLLAISPIVLILLMSRRAFAEQSLLHP